MDANILLKQMTLEEKVGQLFMVGFYGTEVTPEIEELITDYHIGGIIYFRRNIESFKQVSALSRDLQNLAINNRLGIPLFISTDQEGGIVTRLQGGTHFPGNMALGASGDLELVRMVGEAVARELLACGINMDLAPVLDVNNNPENPIIGVRSYGEDPWKVAQLGKAFFQGLQGEGVIACGKHFPGHGDTETDSHLDLPVIRHDLDRLADIEFYPFVEAIRAGIDSIMTSHVYFPAIENCEGIPATLSYAVLNGLLRKELGYQGMIITDCMEMDAIVETFGTIEGAQMTLEAGSDLILISHTLKKQQNAIKAMIQAVHSGRISEERIDQSVRRVLTLKEKRMGFLKQISESSDQLDLIRHQKIALQAARQAVTLVKDEDHFLPIKAEQKVLVLEFAMYQQGLVENDEKINSPLVNHLRNQGMNIETLRLARGETELPDLSGVEKVIICTYNAKANPEQAKIVKTVIAQGFPVIVLALRNPYDLQVFSDVSTYLTTYDISPVNILVASEILTGRYQAQGVLPITLIVD